MEQRAAARIRFGMMAEMGQPGIKREAAWAAAGSIAFAVVFGFPILRHITEGDVPQIVGRMDWDLFLELAWVPFHTITQFHQFPLWDPYKCGGMPMLGNPSSAIITPFMLPVLLFGPVIGLRLSVIAHSAIAFGGAYFLARVLRISELGAVACAGTFAGSSWYFLHAIMGHLNFLPCAYIPWAVALLFLSVERRRLTPAVLGGLMVALMLTEGGVYPFLFTCVTLAVLAPAIAVQRRSAFPFLPLLAMAMFTIGFGATKLLPGLAFTGMHARLTPPAEAAHILRFIRLALFHRNQYPRLHFAGMNTPLFDYGAYLGVIFGALAFVGLVWRFRDSLMWLILALVVLSIADGYFGPYSPWVILHHLPFFASARFPERWVIPFTLPAGVMAGLGTDVIRKRSKPWGARIALLLIAIALIDNWSVSTAYLHFVDEGSEPKVEFSASFRQWRRVGYWGSFRRMSSAARANTGVLFCYEPVPPRISDSLRGYDEPGYRGEQYMIGSGSVKLARWTPNALSFDVEAPCATVMAINQNYYRNWRVTAGRGEVVSEDGLLAVVLPPGRQRIEITYRSTPFLIGLAITLATFGAMFWLWFYERRRGSFLP
ncbi:MAG: hypothetical protein ACREQI_12060 [Candidatus Binataceae bacterium]